MHPTFSLMLHGHIPYCRKSGVWPAGEEWLFEALNETYIPLILKLRQLLKEKIHPHIMIGVVPILAEQLADPYMKDRFVEYMEGLVKRAEADCQRFQATPEKRAVAEYWLQRFQIHLKAFQQDFYRDILGSMRWLQDEGTIEVLTSAATHGFLPLLEQDSAVYSQIHVGIETYKKYFNRPPKGFWFPECAYRYREWSHRERFQRKGLDEWLAEEGIQYFFVEDIGITRAEFVTKRAGETQPTTYRGYKLESGVCVFGRNQATGQQVWSPAKGYPGDPQYQEFHQKDSQTGLHYWRVTGTPEKAIYDPQKAAERVRAHADHFASLLASELSSKATSVTDQGPIIVAPYDWELFGHWWHEGVDWIDAVYRKLFSDYQEKVSCATLSEYIEANQESFSTIRMKPSTWGLNGDFTVWQNKEHGWIWPYVNASCRDFEQILGELAKKGYMIDDRSKRILQQMGRELLLMEGSDWPFLLYTKQAKEYSNQRFHNHHQRFLKLEWAAKNFAEPGRVNDKDLREMEDIDSPWPELDFKLFHSGAR